MSISILSIRIFFSISLHSARMMVNPLTIVNIIKSRLENLHYASCAPTREDFEMADHFMDLLLSKSNEAIVEVETIDDLDFVEKNDVVEEVFTGVSTEDSDDDTDIEVNVLPSSGSSYAPSPPKQKSSEVENISFERMKKIVDFAFSKKDGTMVKYTRIAHNFYRDFKNVRDIGKRVRRMADIVNKGGATFGKLQNISQVCLERFRDAKAQHKIVHDSDIMSWAIEANRTLNVATFRASPRWVLKFKQNHGIVSRKITKIVTRSFDQDSALILAEASNFLKTIRTYISRRKVILNSDQSKIEKEMHSGRTLEFLGTKDVFSTVQSKATITHSFTIQPLIYLDGTLAPVLFMCLQEQSGLFPVRGIILRSSNIFLTCTSSGKLNKGALEMWMKEVLRLELEKSRNKSFVLLLDSWSGHKDRNLLSNSIPNIDVTLEIIPPKVTSIIQPLDLYFFRQWKIFFRKFSDKVVTLGIELELYQRNSIIKIQSIIHFQFCAPPLIQYS